MTELMTIMSVAEVADYLRVGETAVRRLIAKGDIPSFNVDGEPRVQYGALVQWFQGEARTRSLETYRQELQKPSTWRKALDDAHPEFRDQILREEHKDGTVGAFLKEAALAEEDAAPDDDQENVRKPESPNSTPPPTSDSRPKSRDADAHEYLRRISRRPTIAVLVAIGLVVVALGAFTDALQKIIQAVQSLLRVLF